MCQCFMTGGARQPQSTGDFGGCLIYILPRSVFGDAPPKWRGGEMVRLINIVGECWGEYSNLAIRVLVA